jgi:competence protein ComGC
MPLCRSGRNRGREAEVEVVEEEVEVMRLQEIRKEDVVEEDIQSGKVEDKDSKKSN